MADTFATLWNRLQLRAPALGPGLSRDLIVDAFNQLAERRPWSWLQKSSAFYPQSFAVTGTVSTVSGSPILTGVGTNFSSAMIGSQIRVSGVAFPTYTISQVSSATACTLDKPWVGPTASGRSFTVFQCYFRVPADFHSFVSLVNTTANYKLIHWANQNQLDHYDPQRYQVGLPGAAAFYDYTPSYNGSIGDVLRVIGTGSVPVSTTTVGYQYPADSIFAIQVTTPGAPGTAVFQWKQDSGPWISGVVSDTAAVDLSQGVQVYWPNGAYVAGDVFVIPCRAQVVSGVPRYELWPRPINVNYSLPFIYISRWNPLGDENQQLPEFVRGDVILNMALAEAARFPGTDAEHRNPFYNMQASQMYQGIAEKMIYELEKKDDDVAPLDLAYQGLEYFPVPWLSSEWMQSHAPIGII